MDANGLRSFSLSLERGLEPWPIPRAGEASAGENGAALPPAIGVERNDAHRAPSVRLANLAPPQKLQESPASADAIVLSPSLTIDALGSYAVWDSTSSSLYSVSFLAREHALPPMPIALPVEVKPVRDLAFGADDVLYVAGGDAVLLIDMRARFAPTRLTAPADAPEFRVQRLAAHPVQGVYALDVEHGQIARIHGLPRFDTGVDRLRERNDRFEATDPNPTPLALKVLAGRIPANERALAIATSDEGSVAILSVQRPAGKALLRLLREDATLSAAIAFEYPALGGINRPHTLGWLDNQQLALLTDAVALAQDGTPAPGRDLGAFVYRLPDSLKAQLLSGHTPQALPPLRALGDYYPLPGRAPGMTPAPFANTVPGRRPRLYFVRPGQFGLPEPAPLARISLAARASYGCVANFDQARVRGSNLGAAVGVVDSGDPSTAWHRLYVEAAVPSGSAMIVWLAASEVRPPPFALAADAPQDGSSRNAGVWFPHLVGDPRALPKELTRALPAALPRAAWVRDASEVPQGQSLLDCPRAPDVAGLFTALIQRADLRVRTLTGRRLWTMIELFGNGRATPDLAAVRCYAGRKSHRDRYLPALYREQVFGTEAQRKATATGADFLERFIGLFEGLFTSIEDRVANAHLLTDAWACPAPSLPWLARWIGLALEPGMPSARARQMIANGPLLARRHGTLQGLQLALDIATDGAVTRGRVVVVENFRLRRTLATILGAQLADYDDPLTAGIAQSGNSFVGDTLFLGDEQDENKTFLALFRTLRADPRVGAAGARRQDAQREHAVHELYAGLAHRATVLVHDAADDDELRLVTRIATEAAPAHAVLRVVKARYPFLVGVAALIGADTFLRSAQPTRPVRIGDSQLGYVDTLQGLGTLDAHGGAFDSLAGNVLAMEPPIADAGEDREVPFGEGFTLDASRSRAAPGRQLKQFQWTLLPRPD